MKRLGLATLILIGLALLFLYGLFSTATGALMAGFCLWTPFTAYWGWCLARTRIRIAIGFADDVAVAPRAHSAEPHSAQRTYRLQKR
jgi:uncharacterized membrane protein YphA (DoxX/SURF4 family)